jgi:hypothetical protein
LETSKNTHRTGIFVDPVRIDIVHEHPIPQVDGFSTRIGVVPLWMPHANHTLEKALASLSQVQAEFCTPGETYHFLFSVVS